MFQNLSFKIKVSAFIYFIGSLFWKVYHQISEALTRESFHDYFISIGYAQIFKTIIIVSMMSICIYLFGQVVSHYEKKLETHGGGVRNG